MYNNNNSNNNNNKRPVVRSIADFPRQPHFDDTMVENETSAKCFDVEHVRGDGMI